MDARLLSRSRPLRPSLFSQTRRHSPKSDVSPSNSVPVVSPQVLRTASWATSQCSCIRKSESTSGSISSTVPVASPQSLRTASWTFWIFGSTTGSLSSIVPVVSRQGLRTSHQPAGPTQRPLDFLDLLDFLLETTDRLSQSSARRAYAPPLGLLDSLGSSTGSPSSIVPGVSPQGLRAASWTSWIT